MCGVIGWATYGNPESFRHIPLVRLENCASHCTKTTCRFSSINLLNAFASMSTRPVRNSQHVQTPLRAKNRDSIHITRNPSPKCDSVQPTHREITPSLISTHLFIQRLVNHWNNNPKIGSLCARSVTNFPWRATAQRLKKRRKSYRVSCKAMQILLRRLESIRNSSVPNTSRAVGFRSSAALCL